MGEEIAEEKKRAKRCAVIGTVVYLLLIPIMLFFSLLTFGFIHASPVTNVPYHTVVMILSLSVPISMVVSIFTMWSRYYIYERYNKVLFSALLPVVIFVITMVLGPILGEVLQ